MVSANIFFMIIGLIALIDSLFVLIFPKWCLKTTRKWAKSQKSLKRVAIFELLIALILLLIGMNI